MSTIVKQITISYSSYIKVNVIQNAPIVLFWSDLAMSSTVYANEVRMVRYLKMAEVVELIFADYFCAGGDRRHQSGQVPQGAARPRGVWGARRPGGELCVEA